MSTTYTKTFDMSFKDGGALTVGGLPYEATLKDAMDGFIFDMARQFGHDWLGWVETQEGIEFVASRCDGRDYGSGFRVERGFVSDPIAYARESAVSDKYRDAILALIAPKA